MRKVAWWCVTLAGIFLAVHEIGLAMGLSGERPLHDYALVGLWLFLIVGAVFFFGAFLVRRRARRAILNRGQLADAEIIRIENRQTAVVHNPVTCLTLKVRPRGREPFDAQVEHLISRLDLIRMQPGSMVKVKYLPNTHDVVMVDY